MVLNSNDPGGRSRPHPRPTSSMNSLRLQSVPFLEFSEFHTVGNAASTSVVRTLQSPVTPRFFA
jgi:hypothetical protein